MSAMREAFERWSVEGYAQSLPLHRVGDGYGDGETDIAWNDFHAGWQACMEHIKAQGAAHWYLENEDEYMIHENSPITNTFVSVPSDMGQLNCAAYFAGLIAGVLDIKKFLY
jgi:hypothetical protein